MRPRAVILLLALTGCGLTYAPPVDLARSGRTQAQYDADVSACRSQAFAAGQRYQDEHPLLLFGAAGAAANAAIGDGRADADANIANQPGGVFRLMDTCMQRKGYKLTN